MGRNDRLSPSCTEAREREKHAIDRVGRNDRLGRSEERGEAKDRVGRNDRLSPVGDRKRVSRQEKYGKKRQEAVKRMSQGGRNWKNETGGSGRRDGENRSF